VQNLTRNDLVSPIYFCFLIDLAINTVSFTGNDIARFRPEIGRDNAESTPAHIDFFGCNPTRTKESASDNQGKVPGHSSNLSKRKRGIENENEIDGSENIENAEESDSDGETFIGMFANSKKSAVVKDKGDNEREQGPNTATMTKSQAAHAEQVFMSACHG
jgi:hypothetical protein